MRVNFSLTHLVAVCVALSAASGRADEASDVVFASQTPAAMAEYELLAQQTLPSLLPPEVELEPAAPDRVDELEARISELELALAAQQSAAPELLPAAEPAPPVDEDPKKMSGAWGSNGFTAANADESFQIHVGGRVQLDAVALNANDLVLGGVRDDDALNFRRARLRVDGTMYHTMDWCVEIDFVNGQDFDPTNSGSPVTPFGGDVGHVVAPTDLWWYFREVPWVGSVRIGNQKEPIGLEHLCSSRFLDYMERSYLQDAFYGPFNNGFTPGVSFLNHNAAETVTWTLGGYKNTMNVYAYDTGDNEYALDARMSCVPWSACEDRELIHLGIAASYRGLDQDADPAVGNLRIRSRASLRNGPGPLNPNIADTNFAGRIFADNQTLLAPEAAFVLGPWYGAAEYVGGFVNGTTFTPLGAAPLALGQTYFQGSYVHLMYFLTGEHRAYDRHEGRFTRVTPTRNAFFLPGGCGLSSLGAWQVGARYGYLDLSDAGIDGGYIQDLTVGLNWFLNPFTKLQFNYVLQEVDNTQRNAQGAVTAENDGQLHGFGVRFAHDF
jgi:phosphate-selective porin OprO/OprP